MNVADYGLLKNWNDESFGNLKPHEAGYFRRELWSVYFRHDCPILEIGFGNGSFLTWAKSRGHTIEGMEIDEASLESAAKRGFTVHKWADIEKLATGHPKYSLIVCFDVIEHLTLDELHRLFSLLPKLLIPGSSFVARFPNGQSPFGLVNQHGDITHKTVIGAEMIRQLSTMHNLEVVAIRNPALWLHSNPAIATIRLGQAMLAKLIEVGIGVAFHSSIQPMQPNLLAHIKRR